MTILSCAKSQLG